MHVSDFIDARDRLCKAYYRDIVDLDHFLDAMHVLFVKAQVTQGFVSDCHKAAEVYEAWEVSRG